MTRRVSSDACHEIGCVFSEAKCTFVEMFSRGQLHVCRKILSARAHTPRRLGYSARRFLPSPFETRYVDKEFAWDQVVTVTVCAMTKCLGPQHFSYDFDDFTTYDLTTFTPSRLVIDLETLPYCDFSSIHSATKMRKNHKVAKFLHRLPRQQVVKS